MRLRWRFQREKSVHPGRARIYPPLKGIHYSEMLSALHQSVQPDWYLEIGVHFGESLKWAKSKTIAVDPELTIQSSNLKNLHQLYLFQMTSDAFFALGRLPELAPHVDFAFLDGMHQFEFLLRDFINTEKHCAADSVIALHDCVPISDFGSERIWDKRKTDSWTGDVWKLVPILKQYRPDLDIQVLDCPPSGLTVIRNLDPNNTALQDHYDKIVADYLDKTIASYGKEKLLSTLNIKSSRDFI